MFFDLQRLFAFYCLCFRAIGFSLRRIFVCFLTFNVFLHFIAFGLGPSGLGSDGFFFCFWNFTVSFHFIAFGLRPSGLVSDGFFLFSDLQRLFALYCFWFRALGFRLRWIFWFFEFQRLFGFYCLWFKAVGFGLRWIFVCFFNSSVFLHFIAFGLLPSGLGSDRFMFVF